MRRCVDGGGGGRRRHDRRSRQRAAGILGAAGRDPARHRECAGARTGAAVRAARRGGSTGIRTDALVVAGAGLRRRGVAAVRADARRRLRCPRRASSVRAVEADVRPRRLCAADAARTDALSVRADPPAPRRRGDPGRQRHRQQGAVVRRALLAGVRGVRGRARIFRCAVRPRGAWRRAAVWRRVAARPVRPRTGRAARASIADRFHRQRMVAPAQADGDAAGFTPLSVTDAPAPIQVVVG